MNTTRTRFNARARQSSAGASSHKKRKRTAALTATVEPNANHDPNAEVIVPKTKEDKDLDRKERLKQELILKANSKLTSKKKKRLDKYIAKKLRQEERVEILQKLSKSQAESTSLNLQSSSTLGTGKPSTHRDRLDKAEDKEIRRAINGKTSGKRKRRAFDGVSPGGTDDEDDFMDVDRSPMVSRSRHTEQPSTTQPVILVDTEPSNTMVEKQKDVSNSVASLVGSALQRNPEGGVVSPRVIKKKQKGPKTAVRNWKLRNTQGRAQPDFESDSSFDSSDSAYDTTDEVNDVDASFDAKAGTDGSNVEGSDVESDFCNKGTPSDDDAQPSGHESRPKRTSFKDWALQQLSAAKGYLNHANDPSQQKESPEPTCPPPTKKRKIGDVSLKRSSGELMRGPLGEDIQLPATIFAQRLQGPDRPRTKAVQVSRPDEIAEARLLLPIVAEEQQIVEAIMLNPIVIICGETGSGKTTQVPQFLYEAGFGHPESDNPGMIGITQPRRVAAMSMASRVAQELSLTSSRVSYQIRYDATVSTSTSIKFMTDGVLLRELSSDFLLNKYSVIIIDEAHERSMNTDILIGVLSRVIKLREEMWKDGKDGIKPLRLIIMSATLRVSDFAENRMLFPTQPPIIDVAARQHPVTVHFNRRTRPDYVTEAIRKTSKIHARLPPGAILIFLTGQNEINGVCRKLEARYGAKALEQRKRRRISRDVPNNGHMDNSVAKVISAKQVDIEPEDIELGNVEQNLALDVDDDLLDDDDADLDALDSDLESTAEAEGLGIDTNETDFPMHIVPLYSLLPSEKQMRVFEPPPDGHRLVVVATNVAETSLTIPGIRYVVDCGRAKERRYDLENGIQAFQISWVSKASAAQRAGRAGRTGPGHCYRLYSSAVYENYFDSFSKPEILRMPIEGVVLQMKSMHVDAIVNFPFPTPPDRDALRKSEKLLTRLGALMDPGVDPKALGAQITDLGRIMALFPLSPRFSRMLVSGKQHGCLPYVIAIVSVLSVGDPFLHEEALDKEDDDSDHGLDEELSLITSGKVRMKEVRKIRRRAFFQSQQTHSALGSGVSDVFRLLSVVGAYEYAGGGHKFCAENFVRQKAMEEVHKLRSQISDIVRANFNDVDAGFVPKLKPPSEFQLKVLRQLLTAAFIDQVAIRKDLVETDSTSGNKYASSKGVPYRALGVSEDVFIHPTSVLIHNAPPEYLVFNELVRTNQVWIKSLTKINAAWLSSLGKSLCSFSKPFQNKEGAMVVIPKFGETGWELPPIKSDSV